MGRLRRVLATNDFGPANVDTWDCKFIPTTSTLLLGTHGRGVWTQNEIAMNTLTTNAGSVNAGSSLTGTVRVRLESGAHLTDFPLRGRTLTSNLLHL